MSIKNDVIDALTHAMSEEFEFAVELLDLGETPQDVDYRAHIAYATNLQIAIEKLEKGEVIE